MLGCLRVIRNHAECPAGRTSGKDPHDLCRYCFPQFILMFGVRSLVSRSLLLAMHRCATCQLTMPVALLGALADDPLLGLDTSSVRHAIGAEPPHLNLS